MFAREIDPARNMGRKELRDHAKAMLETIIRDPDIAVLARQQQAMTLMPDTVPKDWQACLHRQA